MQFGVWHRVTFFRLDFNQEYGIGGEVSDTPPNITSQDAMTYRRLWAVFLWSRRLLRRNLRVSCLLPLILVFIIPFYSYLTAE